MASSVGTLASDGHRTPDYALLLRETNHRCANDLQLVVSLLSLQTRRAIEPAARAALADATARVEVLARARGELNRERQPSLETALRQVCEALHAQAEPRGILISMRAEHELQGLTQAQIATMALAANELATNAIKHAFEEGKSGHVTMSTHRNGDDVVVLVDDDGLPFSDAGGSRVGGGLGLELVKRLVASIGGVFIMPVKGLKVFEIRVPVAG